MKVLTQYRHKNVEYTIEERDGDIAIAYGVDINHKAESWEVIIIKSHNGRSFVRDGEVIDCPPSEYPPSVSEWGRYGWSYTNRKAAKEKYNKLINEKNNKR